MCTFFVQQLPQLPNNRIYRQFGSEFHLFFLYINLYCVRNVRTRNQLQIYHSLNIYAFVNRKRKKNNRRLSPSISWKPSVQLLRIHSLRRAQRNVKENRVTWRRAVKMKRNSRNFTCDVYSKKRRKKELDVMYVHVTVSDGSILSRQWTYNYWYIYWQKTHRETLVRRETHKIPFPQRGPTYVLS